MKLKKKNYIIFFKKSIKKYSNYNHLHDIKYTIYKIFQIDRNIFVTTIIMYTKATLKLIGFRDSEYHWVNYPIEYG